MLADKHEQLYHLSGQYFSIIGSLKTIGFLTHISESYIEDILLKKNKYQQLHTTFHQ